MKKNLPTKNWSAWHDLMPGKEPTLHVKGEVTCPTSGYSAHLVRHTPPGFNPEIYLLDLVVCPPAPDVIVTEVLTDVPVHYEEQTRTRYRQVSILPEGVNVDVQIVT